MPPQTIMELASEPIPFVNASVEKAFPVTSVYTMLTIQAKKSEARLFTKKDSSPLPQWKAPRNI